MSKVRYCCIQSKDSEQLALFGGSGNFVISTTLKDGLSSAAPSVNTLPRSDGDLQRLTCGFLSNYALSGGIRKTLTELHIGSKKSLIFEFGAMAISVESGKVDDSNWKRM
jgi:hypothetical protein